MSPKMSKEHMEQRRIDLLTAAKSIFIEHGYENATMKHIMDEANVSRGGLYQYFENKEDVFESLLKEGLNHSIAESTKLLNDPVESYWQLLLTRLFGEEGVPNDEMDPIIPTTLEFFITGKNNQRRREYGKARYHHALKLYQDIIDEGVKAGEFHIQSESSLIARTIISFTDGLALDHSILGEKEMKLKEQSELLVEYIKMMLGMKEE